jgi:cytochrome c553
VANFARKLRGRQMLSLALRSRHRFEISKRRKSLWSLSHFGKPSCAAARPQLPPNATHQRRSIILHIPCIIVLLAWNDGICMAAERPDWAFFIPSTEPTKPAASHTSDHSAQWTAPGSNQSYTHSELQDAFNPPDWYPDEHAPMPDIVAHGSQNPSNGPPVLPCALCHLPNGAGHVESASLAGLPVEYIVRQFKDWRSGARNMSEGNAVNAGFLAALKKRYTDDQVLAAARYYSPLKPRLWIRVIETAAVQKSAVDPATLMRLAISAVPTEPIGHRIVELPEDETRVLNRDSHSGYVAYAPIGSIAAGRVLVTQGTPNRTLVCATCHGPTLGGLGEVPPLAGRPPTYLVRQLWAFQSGGRNDVFAKQMQVVVAKLTPDEMLAIGAYLASLPPQ